jgi:hypothetical protein
LGDNIAKNEMGGTRSTCGKKAAYSVLVGKPKGERPLGKTRRRWQENSKLDLEEVKWGGLDWTDLSQDRDRWRAVV